MKSLSQPFSNGLQAKLAQSHYLVQNSGSFSTFLFMMNTESDEVVTCTEQLLHKQSASGNMQSALLKWCIYDFMFCF